MQSFFTLSIHLIQAKKFNKLLCRSGARRGEFKGKSSQLGYQGPQPIPGWGLRWNINLDVSNRLCLARDVSRLLSF
jgi:hypothetical protein